VRLKSLLFQGLSGFSTPKKVCLGNFFIHFDSIVTFTRQSIFRSMGDYSKAWVLLLEYVEKMALSTTSEVSLAALKALQEMIMASSQDLKQSPGITYSKTCKSNFLNITPNMNAKN